MRQWNRQALLRTSVLAGFVAASAAATPALAQTDTAADLVDTSAGNAVAQDGQDVAVADAGDVIVITGSRIARASNLETPNPVSVVSGEDLLRTGETDIVNILRDQPALFSSAPANQSSRLAGVPAGVSMLNLRNLGTDRTLVLIDGQRVVPGVAGSAAVDITTIPSALIERVDISTGGASAIYGADGVSGVVNFILRDDFEGIDYRTNVSIPEAGGGEEVSFSAVAGHNFADGRGNATIGFDMARIEGVDSLQRQGIAGPAFATMLANTPELAAALGRNPDAANVFAPNVTIPLTSALGLIWLRDADEIVSDGFIDFFVVGNTTVGSQGFSSAQVVDGSGVLRDFNVADFFVDPFQSVGGDGTPSVPDTIRLQPQIDRYNVNASLNYDFGPRARFFVRTNYSRSRTQEQAQVNGFNDDIPIALDNPFIPDDLQAQIDALIAEGITPDIAISRDTLDVPNRTDVIQSSFRIATGVEGNFGGNWDYRLTYGYGITERTFDNVNLRIDDRFFAASDAVIHPDTGDIVCRSDIDPDAPRPSSPFPIQVQGYVTFQPGDGQCRPLNLFGPDSTSDEARDFIYQRAIDRSEMTQQVFSAVVTGDTEGFFTLPAGAIGLAFGTEWREETSFSLPNAFELAGHSFRSLEFQRAPVDGRFDVWEVFAETSIPLLRDMPFAHELTFDGAVRYASYSTAGSNTSWSTGGVWAPIEDIRLRATYGQAVRAPNIDELFSPPQPTSIGVGQDPCNVQNINSGSDFREDNCDQLVGPNFNAADFVSAQIPGRAGGNPDLDPETATTITVGAVFTPRFLPGLTATLDWYDVDIEDAIATITGAVLAQNCVDAPSLDNDFCPLIDRDPVTGVITFFRSGEQNIARLQAQGVDFNVTYRFELDDIGLANWGGMTLGINGTKNLQRRDFQFQNFPDEFEERVGEFAVPEWVVNLSANWDYENLRLGWRALYQTSQLMPGITNQIAENNPLHADPMRTGDAWVHHFNGSYALSDSLQVNFGVNNVTDRDPFMGTFTRPVSYLGRTFFLGVNGTF